MSYLEDLRQEAERIRQQKERTKQEAERHSLRRQQAEAFWEESGVGNLVVELKSLLRTTGRLREFTRTTRQAEEEEGLRLDPDSKAELLHWDSTAIGTYNQEISSGWWGSSGYTYDQYRIKQGLIEALPEGDLIFRGNQVIRVPQIGWRTTEGLIGRSMDAFLNDPTFTTYRASSGQPYKVSYLPKHNPSRGYPWG